MLAQCKRRARLVLFVLLTGVYFCWNHWEIWVYILGALVAQIDVILTEAQQRQQTALPSSGEESMKPMPLEEVTKPSLANRVWRLASLPPLSVTIRTLRFLGFTLSFYLLSYPVGVNGDGPRAHAPGYTTLNQFIPSWMVRKDKFYPNIGTALLLLLLVRSDPQKSMWRKFLNSSLPQYMGSISFGFYLVHGPLMHASGYMIPQRLWKYWFGVEGGNDLSDLHWIAGILCGWVLTLLASLWAADVWTREVEGRCVKVVKKLEGWCFRGSGR